MTATIRPSLILNMDVDERQFSDDVVAEVKRSYSYVAPSVVAPRAAEEGAPIENVIRLAVRMHRPYWDANNAASQEQWEAVMPKWLANMFYKTSSTVTACNDVRRKAGKGPLPYAWMEVEFGDNLTVAQATAAGSAFPEDALEVVERVRDRCADGTFGEGAVRVSVPARSMWEEARAQAMEAAGVGGGAVSAEAVDEATEETVGAEEAFAVAQEAAAGEDAATTGATAAAVAAAAPDTADAGAGVEVDSAGALAFAPDFAVDRTLWGITYADGTEHLFDSSADTFVA